MTSASLATLSSCTLTANTAESGGALHLGGGGGSAVVTACAITGNSAGGPAADDAIPSGGAFYHAGSSLVVGSSTVSGNGAVAGGGFYTCRACGVGSLDAATSAVSGNAASGYGPDFASDAVGVVATAPPAAAVLSGARLAAGGGEAGDAAVRFCVQDAFGQAVRLPALQVVVSAGASPYAAIGGTAAATTEAGEAAFRDLEAFLTGVGGGGNATLCIWARCGSLAPASP